MMGLRGEKKNDKREGNYVRIWQTDCGSMNRISDLD
jgi:hypothetical protein